jgi:very-short-patch-repair endonuclease
LATLLPGSQQKVRNPVWVLGVRDFVPVPGSPDRQVAAIAALQRGRVAYGQLRAAGMTCHMIYSRVSRGTLHPLHRAVFAVGHPGRVELGDETAALLAYGPGSALAGRSACWVWAFLREEPDEVHVILPPGGRARSRTGIVAHHSKRLTVNDITICKALPVVKPALALVQLAQTCQGREFELALDEALAARTVSRTKVRETLQVHGHGRRTRYLADLLDGGRPSSVTRSDGEERLRDLIVTADLPTPQMQTPLHGFTADFYWPQAAYVVEFDGYAYHNSRRAFQRDRTKDRTYTANGIQLDRFTWEDITKRPMPTIAHITRQIAERTLMRAQSRFVM